MFLELICMICFASSVAVVEPWLAGISGLSLPLGVVLGLLPPLGVILDLSLPMGEGLGLSLPLDVCEDDNAELVFVVAPERWELDDDDDNEDELDCEDDVEVELTDFTGKSL